MPGKLVKSSKSKTEQTQSSMIEEDVKPSGSYIRHQSPQEAEIWSTQGYTKSEDLAQVNGRLSIMILGMKDLKTWLREIESFLNYDARFGGRDLLMERIEKMEKKIDEYCDKLDKALEE